MIVFSLSFLHYRNRNVVKKSKWKNTNTSLCKNSMGIADKKSCGNLGGIQFQHICQLTQILYSYPSEKKKKSAVFQLLFCLLPHFHFSSHSCPGAVLLSSSQLSLLFHQLCERYECKANVLASHDAAAGCGGGGGGGGGR